MHHHHRGTNAAHGSSRDQERGSSTQQRQAHQDEQIAKMLQAQEYHRAQFPSALQAKGSDQNQSGHRAGAVPRLMGRSMDPAREARHQMRREQLEMALEVNPEAFVSVPMLYVDCELNRVPGERSAHTHSAAWIAGQPH